MRRKKLFLLRYRLSCFLCLHNPSFFAGKYIDRFERLYLKIGAINFPYLIPPWGLGRNEAHFLHSEFLLDYRKMGKGRAQTMGIILCSRRVEKIKKVNLKTLCYGF